MIAITTPDGHLPRPIHDATVYEDTLEIVEAFTGFEDAMNVGGTTARALARRTAPAHHPRSLRSFAANRSYFLPISGSRYGGCSVSVTWPIFSVARTKDSVAARRSTRSGDCATIGIAKSPSGSLKW